MEMENDCPTNKERFVDTDKCLGLINDIRTKLDGPDKNSEAERLIEIFKKTIDPYQEQPELLEPYLADLIQKLIDGLNVADRSHIQYHTIFRFLYQLIKVTGFKHVGKKFPHETNKLPLLIELLEKEDPKDCSNWQTRFVLIVWLSIVILTPFDLCKFDSNSSEESISNQIHKVLLKSLSLHDSCQHVTAYCLAKFYSRPDMLKSGQYVDQFVASALEELGNIKTGLTSSLDDVKLIGYLRTLSYMFKFLPRDEMKKRSKDILKVISNLEMDKINRELVNHLIVKIAQRAGLVLLPKPSASWHHKRGSRILGCLGANKKQSIQSLTATKNSSALVSVKPTKEHLAEDVESLTTNYEELDSADYLETVLSMLFVAAQNGLTKIRLSAAKGIARIAARLTRERASDVIDMVLQSFFKKSSSDFAWHGGCLTLAEMSRNGLILEEKLADVLNIVAEAILYEKSKGSLAVGGHVRESACYVCWAMVRNYEDHLFAPYVEKISTKLLCTMLFDRELQCRRAASAAFQELVGRQGTFNEEGINILNKLDYQNVGPRQFAYLDLALQVASYGPKYSERFAEHLIEKKIGHCDVKLRRLACDSLSALMLHLGHDFIQSNVIPKLIEMSSQNVDLNIKHGAVLGLAKVIRGLGPLQFSYPKELVDFIGNIVELCDKQLKNKLQGPNFIEAIAYMITSSEVANLVYSDDSKTLKQWESITLTALNSDDSSIRDIGSDALLTLYKTHYKQNKTSQDRLLTTLNKLLGSPNENSRCGGLRALSKLSLALSCSQGSSLVQSAGPKSGSNEVSGGFSSSSGSNIRIDADTPDIILMSLASYISKETHEKASNVIFANAKAEACEAFVNFIRALEQDRVIVSSRLIRAGYDALLEKTEDYTFDKRGDIGVVVRRAAIKALQELTSHLLSIAPASKLLSEPGLVTKILARTLQQAVSYHDSAREQAAIAFYKLIRSDLPPDSVPYKEEILALFERYQVNDEFNWRDDSTPIFVSLLSKPEFSSDLWIGLMPASGQVSDSCAKKFRDSLSDYLISLEKNSPHEREQVFNSFLETLDGGRMAERLLTSGLIVADYLLTHGLMNDINVSLQERLAKFCWKCRSGADPKRLISIACVLCSMLQFTGNVQRDCLSHCLAMLTIGYPKVRIYTAEQLYQSIMTYQPDLEENLAANNRRALGDLQEDQEEEEGKEDECEEEEEEEGFNNNGNADVDGGATTTSAIAIGSAGSGVEKAAEGGKKQLQQSEEPDLNAAMDLLSQTNWADPLEKVKRVRDQICAQLMIEPSPL